MRKLLLSLLDEMLVTHAPGGIEAEMDAVVMKRLLACGHAPQQDPHGNIYVQIAGREGGPLTLLSAHKDELSLIVHKIDPDGKLWLEPIGGCYAFKYGEGPMDLLTRDGIIEGVLSVGATHCSAQSARMQKARTGVLTWDLVYLDCKLNREELTARGVMVGDRAVIGRRRKAPMYLRDEFVCGYALDDKGAVAVLLLLAAQLQRTPPKHDLCLAFTCCEEGGVSGGSYINRQLDPHDAIAVEVGPIADEYPVTMNDQPIVLFKDSSYHYSPELSRELMAAGREVGVECQGCVVRAFGSDSSITSKAGLNGRAACLCFATENTHGYEVSSLGGMENCVGVLAQHLIGNAGQ